MYRVESAVFPVRELLASVIGVSKECFSTQAEFSSGQPSKIEASPQSFSQQCAVIQRLQNIEGLPGNLATSNCEQVVRWAYEGRAHSEQLAAGAAIAAVVGVVLLALAS
jgi:hypothetical protein